MDKKMKIIVSLIAFMLILCLIAVILIIFQINSQNNNQNILANETVVEKQILEYNQYMPMTVNDKQMCEKYLVDYRTNAMYNLEKAYQSLDEEYKNLKYPTIESYTADVNKNIVQIMQAKLEKYQVDVYEDYSLYLCVDQNENYYIFKETSPMQYTVILDIYTLPIETFLKKYNSANTETKVAMQVDRVRQALDAQDYHFIYSKLAESFKQNYFPTEADLENYIKNHFFEKNIFTYLELEKQNDNYIYTVKITNEVETQMLAKTFVVQLLDEGDFVFSFSVE